MTKILPLTLFLALLSHGYMVKSQDHPNLDGNERLPALCQAPKGKPTTFDHYYIRPIHQQEISSDAIDNVNYSDPPESCRKCVIYSIHNGLMGVKDVLPLGKDPFEPDPICKVSLAEIEAIIANFQNIITGNVIITSGPDSTADECQKAIQKINELSAELSDLFEQMNNAQNISPEEYTKLKNSYDQKIKELNEQMDFIKKQADQEAKTAIEQAQREMDRMQKELDKALEELKKQIAKYQELLIQTTALAIKDGSIKQAKNLYDELQEKSHLAEIISRAYAVSAIDNIILFSNTLPTMEEKATVCETMVNKMQYDMHSPMVLVVDLYVKELLKEASSNQKLKEASRKLKPGVQNVMNSFGSQIITGNDRTLMEFANEREGILDDYEADLVIAAFHFAESRGEAESGAFKILDFGERLYNDQWKLVLWGYTLYWEMKRVDKMPLEVVLRISHRDFRASGRTSKLFLDLPKAVRRIVAGDPISMSMFLSKNYDNDRIDVGVGSFLANQDSRDSSWIFETDDNGRSYYIKSSPNSYYLYAANDYFVYSKSERRVFAWRHSGQRVGQGVWEIRDNNWKQGLFYLWNKEHGQYLNYASASSVIPSLEPFIVRRVFTWRKDGKGPQPDWEFRGTGWFG